MRALDRMRVETPRPESLTGFQRSPPPQFTQGPRALTQANSPAIVLPTSATATPYDQVPPPTIRSESLYHPSAFASRPLRVSQTTDEPARNGVRHCTTHTTVPSTIHQLHCNALSTSFADYLPGLSSPDRAQPWSTSWPQRPPRRPPRRRAYTRHCRPSRTTHAASSTSSSRSNSGVPRT